MQVWPLICNYSHGDGSIYCAVWVHFYRTYMAYMYRSSESKGSRCTSAWYVSALCAGVKCGALLVCLV